MDQNQLTVLDLPSLVLTKLITMLDSYSIICLSQTCKLFYTLVKQDYFLGITIPLVDENISKDILRKKVLRLMINIEGNSSLLDINWDNVYIDVLKLNNIVQELSNLKLVETSEMCVNIDFCGGIVHQQPKYNYDYLVELSRKMSNLKRYKISINMSGYEPRMAYVHYKHIHDLLKFSKAKEVILKLPDIDLKNFWSPLSVSENAEKLVIIGPCNGLIGRNTNFVCENLKEIILKPSHHNCEICFQGESVLHKNGICVVDIESVLKMNWSVQYYNNVYVGDLVHMRQCCAFNVMAERFYENHKQNGGTMERHDWMECWNKIRRQI